MKKYPIIRFCKECGNKFEINDPFHNSKRYCSVDCQRTVEYRKRKENYVYKPIKEKIYHKHKCRFCGKRFKNKLINSYYCNRKCFENHSKEQRKGINNPAYKNGLYSYKSMTKDDYKKSKHITSGFGEREFEHNSKIIRDNQISTKGYSFCEHCLTSNAMRFETHHLIYRSEVPKHKYLHNLKNLIRLCIGCHNNFHKNKKLRNKYIQERKLNILFGDGFER